MSGPNIKHYLAKRDLVVDGVLYAAGLGSLDRPDNVVMNPNDWLDITDWRLKGGPEPEAVAAARRPIVMPPMLTGRLS